MDTREFCRLLASTSTDANSILSEHVSDNDEILPYLYVEDVARYVLSGGQDRCKIVKCLDESFTTCGPDVENLIAVSFVEHLDAGELERALQGVEAPHILEEWRRQQTM